ncbi:uncharacterized protein LOC112203810 [Rosa chinensis]|uniref:uncharacterized protein LOC112203810 n=1 Tax=Rosa chinensis TaxID=74649 RepID=UPI000D094205|nr:uncharacterized protein LOC112203810 [Rosa chinensis]
MNQQLLAAYTDDEIQAALFQMHPSKAPGPDGMSPFFFQKYWDIVGSDVCRAVRSFLVSRNLIREVNFTHVTLIPKVKDPKDMTELRPIALCNVVYRICSKVLANRLKKILGEVISPLQSAFVPGRLISDNTLVATEVAHFLHKKRSGEEYFSLKLDISKAYDKLEWNFLRQILLKLGFAEEWVDLVMASIQTVNYSFLVNGEVRGYVRPSRGIRQDDSFLFGAATEEECQQFRNILYAYEIASGQRVNLQKSNVGFSKNVSMDRQLYLADILGVQRVDKHEKYLGLPTHVGRSKTAAFAYLKEKLTKKVASWRAKLLSGAAGLGDTPSFSWRSIVEARQVLVQGLRWQVGNFERIEIWNHNWIPDVYPRGPSSPPLYGAPRFVEELIDSITRNWDCAYFVARDLALGLILAPPPPIDSYKAIWKAIWDAKVPSKLALHAWKTAVNILPTRVGLSTKGYNGEMGCLLCLHTLENSLHVFVDCPYAQEVWHRAGLQLPTGPGDNFIDWFLGAINSLTKEQIARCLMLLWRIWKNRNSQLWEHQRQHASEAVLLTMGWYEEFKKVNVQPTESRRQLVKWTRPQANWMKVNCDGAYQLATRKGGAGVVIRDANGDFQAGAARLLPLVTSPFHAELMVLKEGINLAVALQHEQGLKNHSKIYIGVKTLGDLDLKAFQVAAKRRYTALEEANDRAVELCSMWEDYVEDSNWNPYKVIMDETGKRMEIIDEEDKKLKNLKTEHVNHIILTSANSILLSVEQK